MFEKKYQKACVKRILSRTLFSYKRAVGNHWTAFTKTKIGRPALNPRTVFNAILWILVFGTAFTRSFIAGWSKAYLKEYYIISECQNYYLFEIDSTFCKAHQHAKGARKILGNQNIRVSRGGKTTKIFALVNEHFQLVALELSSGNLHDRWL